MSLLIKLLLYISHETLSIANTNTNNKKINPGNIIMNTNNKKYDCQQVCC